MLNILAHNWLSRRLSRRIPNPYMRAAVVTGAGLLATRLLRGSRTTRGTRRRWI